ncbi:MAG: hypothetical protein ACRBB2_09130 [Nitrosopumilus sp.]
MPKWQKDAKEFVVSVNYNETRGTQCNIPKPILEFLENPEKLKFVIGKKYVKIEHAE